MGALFSILFEPLAEAQQMLWLGDARGCRRELRTCTRRVKRLKQLVTEELGQRVGTTHEVVDYLGEMESFLKGADASIKAENYEEACREMDSCEKLFTREEMPDSVLTLWREKIVGTK